MSLSANLLCSRLTRHEPRTLDQHRARCSSEFYAFTELMYLGVLADEEDRAHERVPFWRRPAEYPALTAELLSDRLDRHFFDAEYNLEDLRICRTKAALDRHMKWLQVCRKDGSVVDSIPNPPPYSEWTP